MEKAGRLAEIFRGFFSRYKGKRLAIATHNKADVDGISAAYALSKALPGSVIVSSEEMNQGAKMLSERLGIGVRRFEEIKKKDFEGLVVVDTSAYTLAPDAQGWRILLVIDHHRPEGKDMKGEFEILDSSSPSSAEIVYQLLSDPSSGIASKLDAGSAFALSVGIIADGARFKSARAQTFAALSELMGIAQAQYAELLGYAEPEPEADAKIAMLKAMQRVNFIYAGGYIVATSEVGSNESDAASVITEAADVAFVAKWKDREKETRISARAAKSVKIPLNEVMGEVAKELGGAGGGHAKAAGGAIKAHTDETLKKCVERFIMRAEKDGKGSG